VIEILAAQFNGKPEFELVQRPIPVCDPGGLVVKVAYCAICGTDLKVLSQQDVKIEGKQQRHMKLPIVTGHELSGVVSEVGEDVDGFKPGDRVVVFASVQCGRCHYCEQGFFEMCDNLSVVGYDFDGGFAEYMQVPAHVVEAGCVLNVPEDVTLEHAALAEPISCALNGLDLSPIREGASLVVIGGGPIGNILIDMAKLMGAGKTIILEKSPEQLELVSDGTADLYILNDDDANEKILEATNGYGADVVITACPAPAAQSQALEIVAKRGYINFFGGLPRTNSVLEIDTNIIHYKELSVVGSHGSCARHAEKALDLMGAELDVSKYISAVYPLSEINEAIRSAISGRRLKILIKPNQL